MDKRSYDNVGPIFMYEAAPLVEWRKIGHKIAREYLRSKDPKVSLSEVIDKHIAGWETKEKQRFKIWLKAEMETRYGSGLGGMKRTSQSKVERLLGRPDESSIKQDLFRRISLFRKDLSKLQADGLIQSGTFVKINDILRQLEDEVSGLVVKALLEVRMKRAAARIQGLGVEAQRLDPTAPEATSRDSELREAVDSILNIVGFLERHSVENSLARVAAVLQKYGVGTQNLWDKIGEFAKCSKSITSALEDLVSEISQVRGSEILREREVT